MSEFKGTPGPWRVDDEHDLDRIEIVGRPKYPCSRFGVEGEWRVAEIDDAMDEMPEVVAANARLIAAAPDLLEALIAMEAEKADYMQINNLGEPAEQHTIKQARAAIAKALQS